MRSTFVALSLASACAPAPAPAPAGFSVPVAAPVLAAEVRVGDWVRAWDAKATDWPRGVAITPERVVAVGPSGIAVLAREEGTILRELDFCRGGVLEGESAFVAPDGSVMIVCSDGVYELRLTDFAHRQLLPFPKDGPLGDDQTRCARTETLLAVAAHNGVIVEYDIGTWKERARHQRPPSQLFRVRGLAYAANGRLALASWDGDEGSVELVTDPPGAPEPVPAFKSYSGGLAFSPDGQWLFGRVGLRAAEVSIADGFTREGVALGPALSEARYLDAKHVVATGAHGLSVFALDPPGESALDPDAGGALGVSADGSFVCAGGFTDRLVCFRRSPRR